jgi:hypothetical protein
LLKIPGRFRVLTLFLCLVFSLTLLSACNLIQRTASDFPGQEADFYQIISLGKLMGNNDYADAGWLPDGRLFFVREDRLVSFELATKGEELIKEGVCRAILAPDQETFGLVIADRKGGGYGSKGVKLLKPGGLETDFVFLMNKDDLEAGGVVGRLCFSPDSNRLLVEVDFEWSQDIYLVDLLNKESKKLDPELFGTFLTPIVDWWKDGTIVLEKTLPGQASSRTGYNLGYYSNILLTDLNGSRIRPLTKANDGEFYEYIGLAEDGQRVFFLKLIDGDQGETRLGTVLRDGTDLKLLDLNGRFIAVSLIPGQNKLAYLVDKGNGRSGLNFYDLATGYQEELFFLEGVDNFPVLHWNKEGTGCLIVAGGEAWVILFSDYRSVK